MALTALIGRRLLIGVFILLIVSVLVFAGTEILPGDVATAILGQSATPELVALIRERLGLDDPVYLRYLHWLGGLVTGNLGTSLVNGADLGGEVGVRLFNTFFLAILTASVAVPLSIVLGLLSALKPNGALDRTISTVTLALISLPEFLTAIILVTLFAVTWKFFPAIVNIRSDDGLIDIMRALVLPVATLVCAVLAHMVRMTRTVVLNVLTSPPIEMALLKGVPRWRILIVHALPNALAPIVNVIALNLAYLIAGIVVIETLFNVLGLGRFTVESVQNRDIPAVQVCAMIFCAVYVLLNLLADVISIIANPRLRHPK
ncbi:MAG: ABC transporter permease [Pseudomonadota bacterium]|jgi:peptide/nickel transport system permease protein|uniref:ABC transmembrane type-1 domain-containing protein n=1 Tax=marine metagenome TaxID=408172 RepID=A0A381TZK7_9ZZZZ|nr:ABC transporter permease [Pseudomonadota bacterium]MED5391412.1 ABC transporter permease [Pseudomonadota bacterium]MEE3293288.1 ABC transporter permease [Pseudomonadota bacterium]|tara:strand:- start:635 stop:1588 length:954 start_codon:yes stop_codon:yes gene_type:complete